MNPYTWNNQHFIHEFHVLEAYQRQGVGQHLMRAVQDSARAASVRAIDLESQNTNGPAIRFYRRMGFRIEGINIGLYSNHDYPDGEIAFFMRCRLD